MGVKAGHAGYKGRSSMSLTQSVLCSVKRAFPAPNSHSQAHSTEQERKTGSCGN
jgi:hypothetical protein